MATRRIPIPTLKPIFLPGSHYATPYRLSIRQVHSSRPNNASVTAQPDLSILRQEPSSKKIPSLAILPTSQIIRSYLITSATSSPLLLRTCFAILKRMLDPRAALLSPDRNPLLKFVFKHTFYQQFCAGENTKEVQRSIKGVKDVGYTGVMLEYALEVLAGEEGANTAAKDLEIWRKGMLESVQMCSPGDFVGLKWSGIGPEALKLLNAGKPPTPEMRKAIVEVCDLAAARNVGLLPGAELEVTNVGIDTWTIDLQRQYNTKPGRAIMYTTYQSYLKSAPARLARDLAIAQKDGFTMGVKLVRGAYLVSEPKGATLDSKQATDDAFDALMSAVITRQYNDVLKPADSVSAEFPPVSLMIASHNAVSVEKARKIRDTQAAAGTPLIELAYCQLQGMADEISCELVAASQQRKVEAEKQATSNGSRTIDVPRSFKCATWGTIGQCLNFLYRRAYENQDAAGRTAETRDAMGQELWRRSKALVGITG